MSKPELHRTVEVGPYKIVDATVPEVIDQMAGLAADSSSTSLAFALHVGGLNERNNRDFVAAMKRANLVYADGAAVTFLARLAGARRIERAATTDIGIPALRAAGERLGRRARVALVGGPQGLALRAGKVLTTEAQADVVFASHGFHSDWDAVVAQVASHEVDVLVLGLGMPREALWASRHGAASGASCILTCGGWLGFLAGDEIRAPETAQRVGLEWAFRLRQSPRRLGPRYARGVLTVLRLAPKAIKQARQRGGLSARRSDRGA